MSRFTTPLRLEYTGVVLHGRAIFRLLESFDYELGAKGSGLWLRVPKDFETDFASVPRFFWRIMPPWGPYGYAFVLHDWLYRKSSGFSKGVGDAIMYEALESLGAKWWERQAAYQAVSWFGHSSYQWKEEAAPDTAIAMLEPSTRDVKPEFKKETMLA